MAKKEETQEETISIVQRLLNFQKETPRIYKESDNPYFKSKYSTYENIMKICQPHLAAQGLVVFHRTFIEGDKEYIKTVLASVDGETMESISPVTPTKSDIQSKGAYFTYMKRYHVVMLLGLGVFDEDDDGESQMNGTISDGQLRQLEIILKGHSDLKDKIFKAYSIHDLKFLPRDKFNECKNRIVKTLSQKEKNEDS